MLIFRHTFTIIRHGGYMKKLKVNENVCIGCGACVAIDPEHFEFNDDGHSQAKSNENLESSNLNNAMESCPVGAISIEGCNNPDCNCDPCTCGDDCKCDGKDCNC
jgi:ferredoxin